MRENKNHEMHTENEKRRESGGEIVKNKTCKMGGKKVVHFCAYRVVPKSSAVKSRYFRRPVICCYCPY